MPNPTNNATAVKDVRNWCRDKFGKNWWDVDKSIKKERMSNARKALADKPPNLPESAVAPKAEPEKRAPHPLKPTYLLRMKWCDESEETIEKRTRVDPASCIGSFATYKKIGKREELPTGGGVYLMDTSCFSFDWEECDQEEEETDYYVGAHPFPGYGGRESFGLVKKGDTAEMVCQKLLTYEDIDELMIHDTVWFQLSDRTQEALLRDSLAKEVYICNAAF